MTTRLTSRATAATVLGAAALLLASACNSPCCDSPCCDSPGPRAVAPAAAVRAPAPTAFAAQAARGQVAYAQYCASCHGSAGEGGRAPALVGKGALPLERPGAKFRTMPFHTAGDVARFVVPNMPPSGPKPSGDDAVAILAFALQANGVHRTDAVDAASADTIVLHP